MRKFSIILFSFLLAVFLLGIRTDSVWAQIIDPHPACSTPNSACWPTRRINQHSCSDCTRGWFCFGNTSIDCSTAHGGDDSICGGAGPCMNLCDNTIPNNYPRCNIWSANVICNQISGSTCRWQGTVTNCTEDVVNKTCNISSTPQTLGCCGPGSAATATPTSPPATATPTPEPANCDITITDANLIGVGDSQVKSVTVSSETGGNIDRVDFTVTDATVASATTPDTTASFQTTLSSVGAGATTYTATATMVDEGGVTCSDTANITVTGANAWWQIKESYGVTNGNIRTQIPTTCVGTCDPVFITHDAGDFPGVPTHDGTFGTGSVSSTGWIAQSRYSSPSTQDFNYFQQRIPEGALVANIASAADLTAAGTAYQGYVWLRYDGSLGDPFVLGNDVNLSDRKVILFVDNASVRIEGNINLNDGRGFFLLFSDKNIYVDTGVGGGSSPNLEGMYFADEQIMTGAGSEQLDIRGSLVGYGEQGGTYHVNPGIVFERNLTDNTLTPAEFIQSAPDQIILFPPSLSKRNIIWKEVAP